jgi:hypothetical protein
VTVRPKAGDPARAALVLALVVSAAVGTLSDTLALLLVAPAALGLRMLPAGQWLDGSLCAVLLAAQLGADAGLTGRTRWWDGSAHLVTGALLGLLATRIVSPRPRVAVLAVALLAAGWEIAENASDAVFGTDFAPSLGDTLSDLGLGIAGAILAVAVVAVRRRGFRAPRPTR